MGMKKVIQKCIVWGSDGSALPARSAIGSAGNALSGGSMPGGHETGDSEVHCLCNDLLEVHCLPEVH